MQQRQRIRLGVNIDHVATLRQARRTVYPGMVEAVAACERGGAEGITIHLREDRRHIQDADVYLLRKHIRTRMNLEMANHPDIVAVALEVKPEEVCLVPEKREELTTEGGLDAAGQRRVLIALPISRSWFIRKSCTWEVCSQFRISATLVQS